MRYSREITKENIQEIADWIKGEVINPHEGEPFILRHGPSGAQFGQLGDRVIQDSQGTVISGPQTPTSTPWPPHMETKG